MCPGRYVPDSVSMFPVHYFLIYFMCMSVLPACIYVCHMRAWFLQRSEAGVGSPGTRAMDGCEPPGGCWESWSSVTAISAPTWRAISPATAMHCLLSSHSNSGVRSVDQLIGFLPSMLEARFQSQQHTLQVLWCLLKSQNSGGRGRRIRSSKSTSGYIESLKPVWAT